MRKIAVEKSGNSAITTMAKMDARIADGTVYASAQTESTDAKSATGHQNSMATHRQSASGDVDDRQHNGGAMIDEIYDDLDELPAPPRKDIPEADRELLELAARALGARFEEVDGEGYGNLHFADGSIVYGWNPLQFYGDTFELAIALELDIMHRVVGGKRVEILPAGGPITKEFDQGDLRATTCRAVVRAAAAIGQTMK